MADVLKGLLFKTCLIYLDDIIVWGDCIECHKKNLQEVFDRVMIIHNSGIRFKDFNAGSSVTSGPHHTASWAHLHL